MRHVQQRKQTRKDFKIALTALLQTKSLHDISITEIANRANYNRMTFYRHFECKEDILDELISDVIKDFIFSYRQPYQNIDACDLKCSDITIFNHVLRYKDFYKLVFKSNEVPGFKTRITNIAKNLMLSESHVKSSDPGINGEIKVTYDSKALIGLIEAWVNSDYEYSPQYMTEQLIKIAKLKKLVHKKSEEAYKIRII